MASASSTSSSIILSNVLATESCELRTAIDSYMDTKLKELQEIMKTKVESVITGRLDKFYNKSFEHHDKVLFDKNGLQLINEYNSKIKESLQAHSYTTVQIKSNWPLYPLPTENTNCFTIQYTESINGQGNRISELNYFKTFIIMRDSNPPSCGHHRQWCSSAYNHHISSDCLFAIKHFQIVNCGPSTGITGLGLLQQHPEYFKQNCSEFEALCRREYAEIEKTRTQLKSLMDENISKKDYYASLDNKNKDFEQEKKQLEEERQKIKEEKEKMVFIKEKLVEMKKEVELEKQKISEQKSKTIDIDKCFEDIISFNFISEMPKNKVGPKVAYD